MLFGAAGFSGLEARLLGGDAPALIPASVCAGSQIPHRGRVRFESLGPRAGAEKGRWMANDVVIFMSYAHDDDLVLSADPDELGFVSFLDQQLRLKLRDLGARQANVWRDRRRISEGDQFADIIDEGLKRAELLVRHVAELDAAPLLPRGVRDFPRLAQSRRRRQSRDANACGGQRPCRPPRPPGRIAGAG